MKPPPCQKCVDDPNGCPKVRRHGVYYRTSDKKTVRRFRCEGCKKTFSTATFDFCYRQKKREHNEAIVKLLCSGVSLRRTAKLLSLNRITVVRIFLLEALRAEYSFVGKNYANGKCTTVQFDDLETFEHTKCKPLSVTLAVEEGTRRILGLEVSQMPAKGPLVEKSKKYGPRPDERSHGRERLFSRIKRHVTEEAWIKSDQNPHYPKDVKRYFPNCVHQVFKGRKSSLGGQGELKKVQFDPLFSLNHTCAMLRANVNRLFRKTWCTTKRADRLFAHLILYANYHNAELLPKS